MSFGETTSWGDSDPTQDDVLAGNIKLLEDVFGVCVVDPGDPFERSYRTPNIHASAHDIDMGFAQRVPPCGDQTPAYFGIDGPIF